MKLSLKIVLAVISGVLVCVSFPTLIGGVHLPELGLLAWVALVPLFVAVKRACVRTTFLLTFLSAFIWFGGSLFWVYRAMHTYGHLPALTSAFVTILLVVVVSTYIAVAPAVARFIETHFRGELLVWLPASWVGIEILRNYMPCNGFPWSDVAMSQWRVLPIIQISDLFGVYGVIFLIVWVNVLLSEVVLAARREEVRFLLQKIVVTIVLIAAVLIYGFYRINSVKTGLASYDTMNIGMVQGNIEQGEKWAKSKANANLDIHREGARRLMEASVELVVWPESGFPWPVSTADTEIDPRALGLAENLDSVPYTLLGAISEEPDRDYYNSAILFDADGKIIGRYHKAHLVPFGEYVPYKKLLFFAKKITEPAGNFLAGTSSEPLTAGRAKIGVLICYEDVFPEIARREAALGANLLVNLTNDAWYGVSSAPFQHLAISVFRAVETKRFLVRATNSGVSAVVMPTGEITVESRIFERALMVSPVALIDQKSVYTKYGDWFAWGLLVYVAFGVIASFVQRRRKG